VREPTNRTLLSLSLWADHFCTRVGIIDGVARESSTSWCGNHRQAAPVRMFGLDKSLGVAVDPSVPFPSACSSGYCTVPFSYCPPRHALSLRMTLTYVVLTYVARSLAVRPLPITVGAPLTPPWPLGNTCRGISGLLRPSQGHPRAWPVLVVLARRGSPMAPTPTAGIN
jgi:hypothetical protein